MCIRDRPTTAASAFPRSSSSNQISPVKEKIYTRSKSDLWKKSIKPTVSTIAETVISDTKPQNTNTSGKLNKTPIAEASKDAPRASKCTPTKALPRRVGSSPAIKVAKGVSKIPPPPRSVSSNTLMPSSTKSLRPHKPYNVMQSKIPRSPSFHRKLMSTATPTNTTKSSTTSSGWESKSEMEFDSQKNNKACEKNY
mgnify:CR=1 FL=1